ncbi:MAG: glycosyltransferase, partial [Bacteroides sp.]|nr:glycosyltransferase [Bacteroides sp.]
EYHFDHYKRRYRLAQLEKYSLGVKLLKFLYKKAYQPIQSYDKIVVLTEEDRKSRLIHLPDKIEVIPNPLSFQVEKPSSLFHKRIIAVGRLEKQKGFHQLIHIWSKIEKQYPDWMLTIYGKGSLQKKLEKLIHVLRLSKRIELLPPTPKIKKEIMDSSILVMTSRNEGLPVVLLEGIACGVPPVAFAFRCGPRDIITHGVNGFLSERGDEKDFIRNLRLLMDNENLRRKIGKATYEESMNYQIEPIMLRWMDLFNELVDIKGKI